MTAPLRVVYLSGAGRSGTTLIGNALGSFPGATSWGEIRYVWERGLVQSRWCGCGESLPECPVWRRVFDRADLSLSPSAAQEIVDAMEPVLRTRAIVDPLRRPDVRPPAVVEALGRLYTSLAAEPGSVIADSSNEPGSVIVDSSKLPAYAWLLAGVPDIDLRLVALTRDPRAVAYSWGQTKDLPDDVSGRGHMARLSPSEAAAAWASQTALTEVFARRLKLPLRRIRYEDFVDDPAAVLADLADFAGLDSSESPMTGDGLMLAPSHTVAGNPDRFGHTDAVRVRRDDRWLSSMPARDRWLVTAATAPLLPLYHYPLNPR